MPCLARLSGHFVTRRALFATHKGISVIFSFITPWDTIARGIEPEMPLIARRSAHFVTRRPISCPVGLFLPTGVFWSFFRALPPGMHLHLASKPKCTACTGWSCPGLAKAAGMASLGLARRETTPPYICIFGFSPCGRKKHLFVRGAY
jgi:hypothetical protein